MVFAPRWPGATALGAIWLNLRPHLPRISSSVHSALRRISSALASWQAFGVLLLLSSSCASADYNLVNQKVFRCADGSEMKVQYQHRTAKVIIGDHRYELDRTASNLGKRFASPVATLIADGDFAAFVAEDLHHLRDCRVAQNT